MAIAPAATYVPTAAVAVTPARSVQWGPVILGALSASAISMVLLTFGAGIGLSAASPYPYAGASAKALAVISGLYAAITAVASFAGVTLRLSSVRPTTSGPQPFVVVSFALISSIAVRSARPRQST